MCYSIGPQVKRFAGIKNLENCIGRERKRNKERRKKKEAHLRKGQETKGIRWMPRHQEPKKDVVSCEKLW